VLSTNSPVTLVVRSYYVALTFSGGEEMVMKKVMKSFIEAFGKGPRGSCCEICGREARWITMGIGTMYEEVVLNSKDLFPEGERVICNQCGRYYCSGHGGKGLTCVCGSEYFLTVRSKVMPPTKDLYGSGFGAKKRKKKKRLKRRNEKKRKM
jgi:hypothetical protein